MEFFQGWTLDQCAQFSGCARSRRHNSPRVVTGPGCIKAVLFFLFLAISPFFASPAQAQGTFGCSPAMANDIVCENTKSGSPSSQWDIAAQNAGDPSIQGF